MLVVAITGTGDTTINNASALLSDYLPEDVLVYVPSYTTSNGMKVVVQWLKDANINIERVKRHLLPDFFFGNPEAQDRALIVLGIEGQEDLIIEAFNEDIPVPVYDLTRGLYRVSLAEVAPDGSVSDSESLTAGSGTPVGSTDDLGLEFVTEPGAMTAEFERLKDELKELRKEVSNLRAHVTTGEQGWEPDPRTVSGNISAAMADPANVMGAGFAIGDSTEGKERYYQNGKGKIRKAGRSKIKPGEKEVWLSREEAEQLQQ